MEKEFHLGTLVREELIRRQHSVTWLAKQINCERTNCHTIFRRKFISIELLERISIALNHNFFNDLAVYEDSVLKISTKV